MVLFVTEGFRRLSPGLGSCFCLPAVSAGKVPLFSDEFWGIVTKEVDATNKAAAALNAMVPQLPAVPRNVDTGMKADVANDYIKEISSDVVNGLDNPVIYQNYVDEMNGTIAKLNSFGAWL